MDAELTDKEMERVTGKSMGYAEKFFLSGELQAIATAATRKALTWFARKIIEQMTYRYSFLDDSPLRVFKGKNPPRNTEELLAAAGIQFQSWLEEKESSSEPIPETQKQ